MNQEIFSIEKTKKCSAIGPSNDSSDYMKNSGVGQGQLQIAVLGWVDKFSVYYMINSGQGEQTFRYQ